MRQMYKLIQKKPEYKFRLSNKKTNMCKSSTDANKVILIQSKKLFENFFEVFKVLNNFIFFEV